MVEKNMKNNYLIYLISFFSGFLSLAQEIIWMRLISFAGMSVPQTFSYTLAFFLLGIAVGAQIGKSICSKNVVSINTLGHIFILIAVVDLILIGLVYWYLNILGISILFLGLCVFVCASIRGIVFPLIHHVGTEQVKTGAQISNVYFSNVFGSALAPILIGFIILDYFNTQQTYFLICFLTLVIGFLCLNAGTVKRVVVVLGVGVLVLVGVSERIILELSKGRLDEGKYPSQIFENKYGFIQVYDDEVIFGANVYDGKFNTDIFKNTNGIERAYLLTAIHPNAENILVIGLSTGSWVKVLSTMPNVKKITVIEINPAYIDLIKQHPIVSDLLRDGRIEFIFDDGRKWIQKNQDKKFDIVLMNTTWHWRAYVSNLLSKDFFSFVSHSLSDTGVIYYNTTESLDAYYTAKKVFPYVYKYRFMILASYEKQTLDFDSVQKNLCNLRDYLTQKNVFLGQECILATNEIMKNPLLSYKEIDFSSLGRKPEVITDDNMIVEFKYGKGL